MEIKSCVVVDVVVIICIWSAINCGKLSVIQGGGAHVLARWLLFHVVTPLSVSLPGQRLSISQISAD